MDIHYGPYILMVLHKMAEIFKIPKLPKQMKYSIVEQICHPRKWVDTRERVRGGGG